MPAPKTGSWHSVLWTTNCSRTQNERSSNHPLPLYGKRSYRRDPPEPTNAQLRDKFAYEDFVPDGSTSIQRTIALLLAENFTDASVILPSRSTSGVDTVGFDLRQPKAKRQTLAMNICANKLAQCLLFLVLHSNSSHIRKHGCDRSQSIPFAQRPVRRTNRPSAGGRDYRLAKLHGTERGLLVGIRSDFPVQGCHVVHEFVDMAWAPEQVRRLVDWIACIACHITTYISKEVCFLQPINKE